MNSQKLSNDALIKELGHINCHEGSQAIILEACLRLARLNERDRLLMHVVPETLLLSFVECAEPGKRITIGEVFDIIVSTMEKCDKLISKHPEEVVRLIETARLIEIGRIDGMRDAMGSKAH